MSGFLFSSHDRFGLSQVRRNAKIASAIRAVDSRTPITLVTGVAGRFGWLDRDDLHVVRVPPMATSPHDDAESPGLTLGEAVAERSRAFAEAIERHDPDVVVVDRHPFCIFGELREGLEQARSRGARVVLGLPDVLDDPATVAEELRGAHGAGVAETYHEALVYGERHFCDHESEYSLPIRPRYNGWLVDPEKPGRREPRLLAIAAGGGSETEAICRLGLEVLSLRPRWTAIFAAGPFGGDEALAAGLRPIFPPQGPAGREESIQATRLAALGLADAFADGVVPGDVARLLERPRLLPRTALPTAGITLDGAARAAGHLLDVSRDRRSVRSRAAGRSSRTSSPAPISRGTSLPFAGPVVGTAR
jgi:predicted glycosyltransferase